MAIPFTTPGIYREDVFREPPSILLTGVPVLLGYAGTGPVAQPRTVVAWPQFQEAFQPVTGGFLGHAVRGFFENGGTFCYVVRLDESLSQVEALRQGLETIASLDAIDLVCAPDIMRGFSRILTSEEQDLITTMQNDVLQHCQQTGDRFAILDSWARATPNSGPTGVLTQRQRLNGMNGALYYPWLQSQHAAEETGGFIPPCGHIAGVIARSDAKAGVHKAPANEELEGVLDLQVTVTDLMQGDLNSGGVNCLRAFPGRGIRVWGARTLSRDPAWMFINVRRLFLTAGRWIEKTMGRVVFEPNSFILWVRIQRQLQAYCRDLFRRGALKGTSEEEAYYVKCDEETNPPEVRDAGMVVAEIGLAPALPNEFVIVRIVHGASGVTLVGPEQP